MEGAKDEPSGPERIERTSVFLDAFTEDPEVLRLYKVF